MGVFFLGVVFFTPVFLGVLLVTFLVVFLVVFLAVLVLGVVALLVTFLVFLVVVFLTALLLEDFLTAVFFLEEVVLFLAVFDPVLLRAKQAGVSRQFSQGEYKSVCKVHKAKTYHRNSSRLGEASALSRYGRVFESLCSEWN